MSVFKRPPVSETSLPRALTYLVVMYVGSGVLGFIYGKYLKRLFFKD